MHETKTCTSAIAFSTKREKKARYEQTAKRAAACSAFVTSSEAAFDSSRFFLLKANFNETSL